MYILKFTKGGLADVKSLPKHVKNSLKAELLGKLAVDPLSCSTPLTSALEGWRSFHWQDWRVVFKVYPDLNAIGIEAVGKHDSDASLDVYKKLEQVAWNGKIAERLLVAIRSFTLSDRK